MAHSPNMNIKEYISNLPPSSENNSRAIVISKIKRFHSFPSEKSAREVERVTAGELEADFKDSDLGNEGINHNN